MKPSILICCASSVATSTIIASTVRQILADKNLDVSVAQSSFAEMEAKAELIKPCLIMVTGSVPPVKDIPMLVAMPFLTGIGKEAVVEQMLAIVRKAL